jgi:hypothetical protein
VVAWSTRDEAANTGPNDVVSTGPSRLQPRGSPINRYDQMMQTPEPPGGQIQTKLRPLGSAVKGATPGAACVSHENEWDEIAGESAEDSAEETMGEGTIRTLADLNRYHREKYGYSPMRKAGDRSIRTLRDINRRHRQQWRAA